MYVKTYKIKNEQARIDDHDMAEQLAEKAKRYAALGFDYIAKQLADDQKRAEGLHPSAFYRQLTNEEERATSWFFNGSVHLTVQNGTLSKGFSHYRHDLPPEQVLTELELALSMDLFDGFFIRYLEARRTDPILIGYAFSGYYLLAQWGEESLIDIGTIVDQCHEMMIAHDANRRETFREEREESMTKRIVKAILNLFFY